MGDYEAWGPLLHGLNKPVHDLSRGCGVEDIIYVSAIAAIQNLEGKSIGFSISFSEGWFF